MGVVRVTSKIKQTKRDIYIVGKLTWLQYPGNKIYTQKLYGY